MIPKNFKLSQHYRVALRNNVGREVRLVHYAWPWDPSQVYHWTDGNYGCDCNREAEFNDARPDGKPGWDDPDDVEDVCTDGRFSALYAILPDGSKVPLDDPETPVGCLNRFFDQVEAYGFEAMLHEDDRYVVRRKA